METQEIEFHFNLGEFGWSEVRFFDRNGELFIRTTHIFNHPLVELLESVIELLKGARTANFFWFDEPGTFKVELNIDTNQHHIVYIDIVEHDSTGEWNKNDKTLSEKRYCVELRQLSASIYGEMVKLNELMKIKSYSSNRNAEYPYSHIKEFMKEYERKYS